MKKGTMSAGNRPNYAAWSWGLLGAGIVVFAIENISNYSSEMFSTLQILILIILLASIFCSIISIKRSKLNIILLIFETLLAFFWTYVIVYSTTSI